MVIIIIDAWWYTCNAQQNIIVMIVRGCIMTTKLYIGYLNILKNLPSLNIIWYFFWFHNNDVLQQKAIS